MMSNGQPSAPMYGRRQELPYNAPPMPYQQHPYHGYPHHQQAPQHYPPQPPPHWAGYYNMQPPMQRPYPPYPPMMNPPYYMPQPPNVPSMSPRPGPPQHMPSSSSVRSQPNAPSPSPPSRAFHPPPPLPAQSSPPAAARPPPSPTPPVTHRIPFYPKLPWYSVPKEDFPRRSARRRRAFAPQSSDAPVELPLRGDENEEVETTASEVDTASKAASTGPSDQLPSASSAMPTESGQTETPGSSVAASDAGQPAPVSRAPMPARQPNRNHHIVPVVPVIPSLIKNKKPTSTANAEPSKTSELAAVGTSEAGLSTNATSAEVTSAQAQSAEADDATQEETAPPVKAPPKSWADLVRSKAPAALSGNALSAPMIQSGNMGVPKNESLADALVSFEVKQATEESKIPFLKPRGLVNTGNMCYMNSVLQVLVSNVPFYDFLDQIARQAGHSFKSDTPMLDALIMFLREFPIIDSAASVEQLNLRLKDKELEEYGDPFIPEFVYEVIRRLPRFASMRRGHQQDTQEFLGFLLEQLHEECVHVMKMYHPNGAEEFKPLADLGDNFNDEGWLEVGPKQKASVTRSSGISDLDSPITKIFGGKLRSELRIPGAKNSVTLEPYQPLQLDIDSPQVNNIIDALKNLTKPETLHGDFNSPRGPGGRATKQVSIETLPPVLILHLKRFQYDNAGGTQKIWKKIGYPIDLEIPKEVFPAHKRGGLAAHGGLPKYRLIGVIYHHGKSASGGHYTVDIRRQNEREWIRFDDTVIRRIRREDVAEGGSEEDPKVLAGALEQHKRDQSSSSNIFDQVREESEEQAQAERGWSQVNGSSPHAASAPKKWSGIGNGAATPPDSSGKRTPVGRYSVRDNKVAYLLFYQKVGF